MKRGFTLIELLVTIAIIGLLASIVLVALDLPGRKTQARQVKALEFSQSMQNAIGDELVGSWTFENVAGGKTPDMSGYNNEGTIYGATQVDGLKLASGAGTGKALSFNGTSNYVNLTGLTLNNGGNLTIAFWANFLAYDGSDYIVDIELGRLLIGLYGNNFNFYDNAWKNYDTGVACAPYLNSWHHYVFTFDIAPNPDVAKLYIDGKLIGSNSSYLAKNISGSVTLMSRFSRDQAFVKGILDEVRIYAKALTIGEIQKQYAAGAERHQNLATK